MELPVFRYHPDPIASGSVVASDERCDCCGAQRGFVYRSSVYWEGDGNPTLCPWCIADGSAHQKFDASFNDTSNLTDADIAPEIADEVAYRTPGFDTWQQELWLSCCDDAAAFLGAAGYAEIREKYPELRATLMQYFVEEFGMTEDRARPFLEKLNIQYGPTAYVFACLHCGARKAFVDYT